MTNILYYIYLTKDTKRLRIPHFKKQKLYGINYHADENLVSKSNLKLHKILDGCNIKYVRESPNNLKDSQRLSQAIKIVRVEKKM